MLSDAQILAAIRDRVDHPATLPELIRRLKIPREERASFRRRVKHLIATGALIETRGQTVGLPDRMHLATGRIEMNAQGYAFVRPERPLDEVRATSISPRAIFTKPCTGT